MLDRKTDAVLIYLTKTVGNSYKVLNKNQILEELPKKLGLDMQTLTGIITFLKENEYVQVKYQDKEEICITTTVKAESYVVGEKDITQKAKITNGQVWFLLLGVFFAAFLGALIATLIGKLL